MKHLIFDCGGVLVWPRLGEWNIPFGIFDILAIGVFTYASVKRNRRA